MKLPAAIVHLRTATRLFWGVQLLVYIYVSTKSPIKEKLEDFVSDIVY